jgi:uncharacterized protein YndB with AHSA1/START domain
MPIKKDGTGKRWVEMDLVTPGTPEQVWQAMATGPGNTAWFIKTTVDGRIGGEIRFDFGGGVTQPAEITTWEPPHRLGYVERNWSEGAPPVATEITITARSGDQCTIRMVHSLFASSDDWDDQMESFEKGWPSFFDVLRIYLAHFAGRPAATFMVTTGGDGDHLETWKRLMKDLQLSGADVGDRRTVTGPEPLSGVIERIRQDGQERVVAMRLDAPAPGVWVFATYLAGTHVNATTILYFYGDGADALAGNSEPKWRDWLTGRVGTVNT